MRATRARRREGSGRGARGRSRGALSEPFQTSSREGVPSSSAFQVAREIGSRLGHTHDLLLCTPTLTCARGRPPSTMTGVGEHRATRRVVLFLVASCYFAAFSSLHAQYPGLLGSRGVEPVDALLQRLTKSIAPSLKERTWALPTVLWLHEPLGVSVDALAEGACLIGATLAACSAGLALAAPGAGASWLWISMFGLYLSLFVVGQTFLSFQWDILLLEAGFLCAWLCPLLRPTSRDPPSVVAVWLLRFLLFKLMLMSGVVKIQANCPTWLNLTALDFHWATQPLPTPAAWFAARYTTPGLRRAGVAATLALEGPATLLLVSPFRLCRHVGAWAQVALQVAIAATGNYCFFNLLTIALAFACFDDAALPRVLGGGRTQSKRAVIQRRISPGSPSTPTTAQHSSPVNAVFSPTSSQYDALPADPAKRREALESMRSPADVRKSAWKRTPTSRRNSRTLAEAAADGFDSFCHAISTLGSLALGAAILANCAAMFRLDDSAGGGFLSSLALVTNITTETNKWLAVVLPVTVAYFWIVAMPVATLVHATREVRRSRSKTIAAARVLAAMAALAVGMTFFRIAATPMASLLPREGFAPSGPLGSSFATALPPSFLPPRLEENIRSVAAKLHVSNAYGLFRRMTGVGPNGQVARPEVILQTSVDGERWTEVAFRHKPGDPTRAPTWVAPHQPRLDWQMWFAALGSYNANPWLIHFAHKLLRGDAEVVGLLDETSASELRTSPPKFIRGIRHAYAFSNGGELENAWWVRDEGQGEEYLPAIDIENGSVARYLASRGWGTGDAVGLDIKTPLDTLVDGARELQEGVVTAATAGLGVVLATTLAAVDLLLGAIAKRFALEQVGRPRRKLKTL